MHPEFAPVAFIAALSLLIPLPWHWRAGNVATLAMIAWLFVSDIIYAVDAIVWSNNVDIVAPVWCDISTKLIIGANFALPAACLCICIHLEQVASIRRAQTTISDKRRRQYFEAGMCFGLPLLFMALHYVVQGHRFDIIEGYGCRPTTYFSIPSLFIVWIPPILMAIAAIVFAGLAFRHFMLRRLSFAAHLNGSNSALTTSRYLRLMFMAALQMFWSITVTSYTLWFTVMAIPIRPWTNWADVHSNFSRIDLYPALFTPEIVLRTYYTVWWMVPLTSFMFVAFFAFGRDAVEEYKKCWVWVRTRVLRITPAAKGFKKSIGSLPTSRSARGKPISSPRLTSSSEGTITMTPLPYKSSMPHSPNKSMRSIDDSDYDATSEFSQYESTVPYSYQIEPIVLGSLSDLGPLTPSTIVISPQDVTDIHPQTPLSPPSPLTPPPAHPTLRTAAGYQSPTSPRPFTYPSNDPQHRNLAN